MPSKLTALLNTGAGAAEHPFELEGSSGREDGGEAQCRLDTGAPAHADWVRVAPGLYSVLLGARSYEVRVRRKPAPPARGAQEFEVRVGAARYAVALLDPRSRRQGAGAAQTGGLAEIRAPMPGRIVKLLVSEGDAVSAGQGLLVMEAMKMQNELRAPRAGRVDRIYALEGAGVETGAALLRLS
jgi:biotin carboxyl carrier protein